MGHILDNPVWNALNTGNEALGKGTDGVKYYRSDISPFVGLRENNKENLTALYNLIEAEEPFGLVVENKMTIEAPWVVIRCVPLFQMVCEQPVMEKEVTEAMTDLDEVYIPQMTALAKLTQPGPFKEKTIDFGHYQGIFYDNQLVAMAGQRMYAPPYAEISAVCTHPDFTGRGFAAQLMLSQIKRITGKGEIPFLHVAAESLRAIKIYELLGFRKRKEMYVYFIKRASLS